MIDYYLEIKKRYGAIRRARGFYLYTEKNIRLIDMYLDGGKSLLGRRSGQKKLVFKQYLDKGLMGFFPTKAETELQKAIAPFFPDYPIIRWYDSEQKAQDIICNVLGKVADVPFWRPHLPDQKMDDAVLVCPPFPTNFGIVVCKSQFEGYIPNSDKLFPPLLATLARSFYDLAKDISFYDTGIDEDEAMIIKKQRGWAAKKKAKQTISDKKKVLELMHPYWEKKGIYLYSVLAEDAYSDFFIKCLESRILISPSFNSPSLLPRLDSYTELLSFLKRGRYE